MTELQNPDAAGQEWVDRRTESLQEEDGRKSTLTITLAQMNVEFGQPKGNFERAATLIAQARKQGSNLVVLPELFSTGYDLEHVSAHACPLTGRALRANWFGRLAALAKANGVWLTASMLEVQPDGRYYNCMPVYSPSGSLVAAYRKIHLCGLVNEDRQLAPGQDTTLLHLPWGLMGLAISYDLQFPELFRRYALHGAQLLVVPAQWPSARKDHWATLLRARAIENQCFVVGCNRAGTGRDTGFCGHSAVVDPWGRNLAEGGEDEGLLTVKVDLAETKAARKLLSVLEDRRPELY
jgi:omega-amidase